MVKARCFIDHDLDDTEKTKLAEDYLLLRRIIEAEKIHVNIETELNGIPVQNIIDEEDARIRRRREEWIIANRIRDRRHEEPPDSQPEEERRDQVTTITMNNREELLESARNWIIECNRIEEEFVSLPKIILRRELSLLTARSWNMNNSLETPR